MRLLTDESSSVSAMVQSNRAQGMVVGSASGQVSLTLIRSSQTVNVGDVVVTSGLGGVFPKGLPIGKVTSVQNNPGSLYLDVVVEPFAHTESFEEVLVDHLAHPGAAGERPGHLRGRRARGRLIRLD